MRLIQLQAPILALSILSSSISALVAPTAASPASFITQRSFPSKHYAARRFNTAIGVLTPHAEHSDETHTDDRRSFLAKLGNTASTACCVLLSPKSSSAAEDDAAPSTAYTKSGKGFSYTILPPPDFTASNKPLKTHLDEINFTKEGVRGYQYGITIDPVRIDSLRQFGTPEEVAARVVTAEINRDGITDVTLFVAPREEVENGGCYAIDYISYGKRGTKHLTTRIYIQNNLLFVLTAQTKEDDFLGRQKEMLDTVNSFRIAD